MSVEQPLPPWRIVWGARARRSVAVELVGPRVWFTGPVRWRDEQGRPVMHVRRRIAGRALSQQHRSARRLHPRRVDLPRARCTRTVAGCAQHACTCVQVETEQEHPAGTVFALDPRSARVVEVRGRGFAVTVDVVGVRNGRRAAHVTVGFHVREEDARAHEQQLQQPAGAQA